MKRKLPAVLGNERGLTAVELLITAIIVSLVMGATYTLFSSGLDVFNRTDRDTAAQVEARFALEKSISNARVAESLSEAEDYHLSLRADLDDNDEWEFIDLYLTGTDFYRQVDTATPKLLVQNVQNSTLGIPIFTYYDTTGTAISDTQRRLTSSYKIGIEFVVDNDLAAAPDPYRLKSETQLRNFD